MQITRILNNNCFSGVNRPRFVILHSTAGGVSAEAIARFFQNAGVSAHYVIGQDGQIVQCNEERDGAWADGIIDGIPMAGLPFRPQSDGVHRDDWWNPNGVNPNDMGIAIEHCKPHNDNSDALTPAQQASSLWLVNDICTRHNIPKRFADANGGITGHFSIAAESRQRCPGAYPWQELFDYLNGGNTPMSNIPSGWSDDGHTLKAPNGIPVVLGFRDKVLNANPSWDPTNWPMRAEYHADPVEQSHPTLGAGPAQEFRMDRLAGCASLGLYKSWPGQELYWYQKQHTALQTQVALLQSQVADLQSQLNGNALAQDNQALRDKIEQAVKDLS